MWIYSNHFLSTTGFKKHSKKIERERERENERNIQRERKRERKNHIFAGNELRGWVVLRRIVVG